MTYHFVLNAVVVAAAIALVLRDLCLLDSMSKTTRLPLQLAYSLEVACACALAHSGLGLHVASPAVGGLVLARAAAAWFDRRSFPPRSQRARRRRWRDLIVQEDPNDAR